MNLISSSGLELVPVFQETAGFLRSLGAGAFELTEPHLLYLKSSQAQSYLDAMKDKDYNDNGFHGDLRKIVKLYAAALLSRIPNPECFELVDLGPGYPDKTLPLLRQAVDQGIKKVVYCPVDVSPEYLRITIAVIQHELPTVEIKPLNLKFEDVSASSLTLMGLQNPYIFLGLTYMNFPANLIGGMLRRMCTPQSRVFVASELLTENNSAEQIIERYNTEYMKTFAFGPIANLGYKEIDFNSRATFNNNKGRVEMVNQYVGSPIDALNPIICEEKIEGDNIPHLPFKIGDEITTLVSYRTTAGQMIADLAENFSQREMLLSPSGNTALAVCGL